MKEGRSEMNAGFVNLIIPAVLACSCNAAANTFWKFHFMKQPLKILHFRDVLMLAFTPFIIVGVVFYVISMVLFFYMLSHFKLSLIVPLTSLTYVLNLVVAYVIFHERFYIPNIIGTGVVIIGLIILSQTPAAL
jgi:drug/metabolite transporter (DMT)-like permease